MICIMYSVKILGSSSMVCFIVYRSEAKSQVSRELLESGLSRTWNGWTGKIRDFFEKV